MSLFERLFTLRQNDTRSPFEDFLTEVLAEWLRQVTLSGSLADVLIGMFKMRPDQLCNAADLNAITWETQHIVGPGHRATGKRPDLIGRGPDFFLIIENKISAGFTQHEDHLGELEQLPLYESYWEERSESHGGTLLLTHTTLPPKGWALRTVYWRDLEQHLRAFAGSSPDSRTSALNYLTRQLTLFLGENGMNGTRIALEDITAFPAYQRLTQGLTGLGKIAENHLKLALQNVDLRELKAPRGGASGDFIAPSFFGWTLSNGGSKSHDACLVLWSGTVAGEMYHYIKPATAGIPELSVGIGLWCDPITDEDRAHLDAIVRQLNLMPAVQWDLCIYPRNDEGPVILLSARRSLIDAHVQSAGCDLDDIAGEFYQAHCAALFHVLSLPMPSSDKSVEQYLYHLTCPE